MPTDGGPPPDEAYGWLVDHVSELVVVVDGQGRLRWVNPVARSLTGHDPDDLVGETLIDYVHDADVDAVGTLLAGDDGAVATTRPRNAAPVEARLRTAGGEWRWLSFAAGDRIESPTGVVLSARVLADERLHDRQDDRLDTLARTVSHDLRTPLSVASGSLALYRQTGDGELLDRIQRAHERIEQLTAELLAHARQGRVVDDTHPVSLRDCAVAALSTTPLPADRVTVAETLPTVEGDDSRVRALFENLFRNVADHAGPDTRVWVERLPAPPGRDATDGRGAGGGPGADDGRDEDDAIGGFVVEDDGPGIPAADAESVFEPGYSTDADGTGLGLDIVAAIAAAHGWEVTVTEGRAGGARFEFRGVDVADEA